MKQAISFEKLSRFVYIEVSTESITYVCSTAAAYLQSADIFGVCAFFSNHSFFTLIRENKGDRL